MTHPTTTTLGLSAGSGMVHCALVTVDDHDRIRVDSRVIDIDPTDRLDRAGRLNSGIALMLDRAAAADLSVGAIGVAARGGEIPTGGAGTRRQVHVIDDPEAVGRALAQSGAVAAHPRVIVVDAGDSGTSVFVIDTRDGTATTPERTTGLSGAAIDTALAERASATMTDLGRRRRAELRSACRTAKEELAEADTAIVTVAGQRFTVTAAMVEELVAGGVADVTDIVTGIRAGDPALIDSPVVLVGGLATMASVRAAFARALGEEPSVPDAPELVGAVGAALAARPGQGAPTALEFIGGRRHRDLLSVVPVAVIGAVLVAAMLTAVVVGVHVQGASVTGDGDTPASSTVVATTTAATSSTTTRPAAAQTTGRTTTDRTTTTVTDEGEAGVVTTTSTPDDYSGGSQRTPRPWATTVLPTSEGTNVPTSTITPPSTSAPLESSVESAPLTPYPFTPIPGPTTAPESVDPDGVGVQGFSAQPQPTTGAPAAR
ncbi:hypothetical protein [uncultured Williamsia sp.]|uniref:hypothetical protein n=1 Tax=uncultured Williamsia sp. TaxID=259311 RepID=UPI002626DDD7|nr:hypothetical protein [uncultured Williamsia sp.]